MKFGNNFFTSLLLAATLCVALAFCQVGSVAPILSYGEMEIESGFSDRGVIRADGSIWVGDRLIVDERGNLKVSHDDLHWALKGIVDSIDPDGAADSVLSFAVRTPQSR